MRLFDSPDPLLTATLADAEKYQYTANCTACHRSERVDLKLLRDKLGPDFRLRELRQHLRCKHCGAKGPIVSLIPFGSSILIR